MAVRVQVGSDGTVGAASDPSVPTTREQKPEPIQAQLRINEGAQLFIFDTETGAIRHEENHAAGYRVAAASPVDGVTVRNNYGMPLTLEMAGPEDVVNIASLGGETSIKAAVQLGKLRPRVGGGYEVISAEAQAQAQAQQQQQQQREEQQKQDKEAADPADLRDVRGTSAQTDAIIMTMATETPAALEGAIEAFVRGSDPSAIIASAGEQLRDETFVERATAMHAEFLAAGQQVLRNVGVENFESFDQWARDTDADGWSNAVRGFVLHHDASGVAKFGRRFVSQAAERMVTLFQAKGYEATLSAGTVYVKRSSLGLPDKAGDFGGWSTLRQLKAEGVEFA